MKRKMIKADGGKMIYSKLKSLISDKSAAEHRKITYRTVSEETGLSTGTLVRLCDFKGINKIEARTINILCRYFNCDVGDLLKFYDDPAETLPADMPEEDKLLHLATAEIPDDLIHNMPDYENTND